MSVYGLNKACHLVQMDAGFRERLQTYPAGALADLPLTDEERRAFLEGDVAAMYRLGANSFLMWRLARFSVFGLTGAEYIARIRTVLAGPRAPGDREGR